MTYPHKTIGAQVGDIVEIEYWDHFNGTEGVVERSITQKQIGYYVGENDLYVYFSLSRHLYDGNVVKWEEQVGVVKSCIVNIQTFK